MRKIMPATGHWIKAQCHFILPLLFAILILTATTYTLFVYTKPQDGQYFDLSPELENSGWSVYTFELGAVKELEYVGYGNYTGLSHVGQTYYTTRLMTEQLDEPILQVGAIDKPVSIFLDGELLYTDMPSADNRIGTLDLSSYHLRRSESLVISLPYDYIHKQLTIAQCDAYGEKPGYDSVYPATVILQTKAAQASRYIADTIKDMLPVIFLAFITLILLIVFLYQSFRRQWDFGVLFLLLYTFFWMIYLLTQSSAAQYMSSAFGENIYNLSRYGSITFILLFLRTRMKTRRCRRIMLGAIILQAGTVGLSYLSQFFAWNPSIYYTGAHGSFIALLLSLILIFPERRAGSAFYTKMTRMLMTLPLFMLLWLILITLEKSAALENLIYIFTNPHFHTYSVKITSILRTFFLLSSTLLVLYESILRLIEQNTTIKLLEQKNRMSVESYENLQQHMNEVSRIKHDIKKHYAMIYTFLRKSEHDQALSYVESLLEETAQIKNMANTKNHMINTIFNSKAGLFEKENIHTSFLAGEVPEKLPLTDTELCSLFLNILDNAVAEVCRVPPNKRHIEMNIFTKNQHFYFSCKNTALSPTKQTQLASPVKGHGYGLQIIRQIVHKHHGMTDIIQDNDCFTLTIILPLNT